MTRDTALEIAARCWCEPRNSGKVMDPDLAESFADALVQAIDDEIEMCSMPIVMGAADAKAGQCDGVGERKCSLPGTWQVVTPRGKPRFACDRCKVALEAVRDVALEAVRDERLRVFASGEGFHLDKMTFTPIEEVKS